MQQYPKACDNIIGFSTVTQIVLGGINESRKPGRIEDHRLLTDWADEFMNISKYRDALVDPEISGVR